MLRFDFFFSFVSSFKFLKAAKEVKLPCHSGWLLCIKSLKALCLDLLGEKKILSHICLWKCNQDHVENLHSQIQGYNGFNDHPNAESYINALRCLACRSSTTELLDKTISSVSNCLPDGEDSATSNSSSVADMPKKSFFSTPSLTISENLDQDWEICVTDQLFLNSVESEVVTYIAGNVLHKLKKTPACSWHL